MKNVTKRKTKEIEKKKKQGKHGKRENGTKMGKKKNTTQRGGLFMHFVAEGRPVAEIIYKKLVFGTLK